MLAKSRGGWGLTTKDRRPPIRFQCPTSFLRRSFGLDVTPHEIARPHDSALTRLPRRRSGGAVMRSSVIATTKPPMIADSRRKTRLARSRSSIARSGDTVGGLQDELPGATLIRNMVYGKFCFWGICSGACFSGSPCFWIAVPPRYQISRRRAKPHPNRHRPLVVANHLNLSLGKSPNRAEGWVLPQNGTGDAEWPMRRFDPRNCHRGWDELGRDRRKTPSNPVASDHQSTRVSCQPQRQARNHVRIRTP